jgi:tetratricopeptide (TPR) repeat protein
MSDALYERYKDALRRGHVAAVRDRLDAALIAYSEAAEIAPERALPHASLAAVLVKLGRRDEALAAYSRAVDRAPRDEAALSGRAQLLASLGRRVDAADDLDAVANSQEADGRLVEAADTALRALQLAESKARRRHVESLARTLHDLPGNELAASALERALGVGEPVAESAEGPDATAAAEGMAEPEEPPAPPPDGAVLTAEAEDLLDAGETDGARDRLILAARAHHANGRISAALDACYLALGIAPFDFELHLLLAELYLEQGWQTPAADKLVLLGRLVDLAGDSEGRQRICSLATTRIPDDERLAALCA